MAHGLQDIQAAARADAAPAAAQERRITGLDGLRGLMTLMVIISHYFGEVEHGIRAAMFGWVAVNMFFVLSGFLIGKLILDKQHHANFFTVFYVRRFCRILPAYIITAVGLFAILSLVHASWADADVRFPLWSYLTFSQGFFMVATQSIGAHWLAPTWTLAVEEYFYLVVPAAIVFTPRRWLVPALVAAGIVAVILRVAIYGFGFGNEMMALALLPGRADVLVCGVLAAVAVSTPRIPWAKLDLGLRITPIVAALAAGGLKLANPALFGMFGPLLIAIGCTAFLLCIVRGAPEAKRFESKVLQFFGNNGYCLYLTHLPILGLAHGLILGARPDLATPQQWLVTIAALPVCVLVGWGMTKLVEEPLTHYGRTWRWSPDRRQPPTPLQSEPRSA